MPVENHITNSLNAWTKSRSNKQDTNLTTALKKNRIKNKKQSNKLKTKSNIPKVEQWTKLAELLTGYPQHRKEYLTSGFQNGFILGLVGTAVLKQSEFEICLRKQRRVMK